MYTTENYFWGAVAYVIGLLLITPLLWRATRFIPWHPVKSFFRIAVIVGLATPAFPYQDLDYLAPAWLVSVFEVIKPQTSDGIWRGLKPIIFCFVVVYIVELCLWRLLRNDTPKSDNTRGRRDAAGSGAAKVKPSGKTKGGDRVAGQPRRRTEPTLGGQPLSPNAGKQP